MVFVVRRAAALLLVAWLAGVFDSSPKSDPEPAKPTKKDEKPIRKNQPPKG